MKTRARRPKIVAIGGGHGLATVAKSLCEHAEVTAITGIADSGSRTGDVGRLLLRLTGKRYGLGDARHILSAITQNPTIGQILETRFDERASIHDVQRCNDAILAKVASSLTTTVQKDTLYLARALARQGNGLRGHTYGNIALAGLVRQAGGIQAALRTATHWFDARASVLAMTSMAHHVYLEDCGTVHRTEAIVDTHIPYDPYARLWLSPIPTIDPLARTAIETADQIVIAPGSATTSILANLAVGGAAEAITAQAHRTGNSVAVIENLVHPENNGAITTPVLLGRLAALTTLDSFAIIRDTQTNTDLPLPSDSPHDVIVANLRSPIQPHYDPNDPLRSQRAAALHDPQALADTILRLPSTSPLYATV